ncbi:MAG: helix-turn-helix transcriptional regulator [Rhodanobacteraceae bacterium]
MNATLADVAAPPFGDGRGKNTPHAIGCEHRSTQEVPKDARFDYWRRLFTAPVLDHPHGSNRRDFSGELRRVVMSDGTSYSHLHVDSHQCRFGVHDSDLILFGQVRSGCVRIRHGRDEAIALDATSGVVLYDCGRTMLTSSSCNELIYLTLPRATVAAAIGGDPVPRGAAARLLQAGALASGLTAYLRALERENVFDDVRVADAVRIARALALVTLAGVQRRRRWWPDELDEALYITACHQLARRMHDPRLIARSVAETLGCSRAHLYRLFASRGESIAARLYKLRMQRAAGLLVARPGYSVGAVASRCGYTDLSAFGKAFRREFGVAPNAWRAEHIVDHATS